MKPVDNEGRTMELCNTPIRTVGHISKFTDMDHILHGGMQGQNIGLGYRPLGNCLAEWITQESYSSKIAFVVHQPKDNIVAAERLAIELGENYHVTKWGVGLRNRSADACELEHFIKKKSLIKAAKANGIWKRPPILTEVLLGVVTGIIVPLLSYVLNNSFLPTALAGVILLILTGHYIHKYRVCQEEGFHNLKTAVKKFPFNEYHEFIKSFNSRDFLCEKCQVAKGDVVIVRDIHTPQHFLLLRQYLSNIDEGQFWVVFLERKNSYNDFVQENRDYAERRVYYLNPLTKAEKRELAKTVGISIDNPVISRWGVDYILRNSLRLSETISPTDIQNLTNRIQEFVHEKEREGIRLNLVTLIRFVAQLRIEFFPGPLKKRLWELLFDYQSETPRLNEIDRELSLAVFFMVDNQGNGNQVRGLKGIVLQILSSFEDDFEDIMDNPFVLSNSNVSDEYEKLMIVKALRHWGKATPEWCVALGDALQRSLSETKEGLAGNWRKFYDSTDWKDIFIFSFEFLESSEVRWFSPWLVHNCLDIYGKEAREGTRFFSKAPLLTAARSNVLLDLDNSELGQSVVRDHLQVVHYAVIEIGENHASRSNSKYPDSFSLLNLKNNERKEYYNALKTLNEVAVLQFYEYLFDVFCGIWRYAYINSNAKLWCCEVAHNDLFEKYYDHRSILIHRLHYLHYYLKTIISKLLKMVGTLYGEEENVRTIISEATDSNLNQLSRKDREETLLRLIPQAEMSSYATLVFAVCILCRLETDEVSRETFMGIGNDLIRMVFLLLHESSGFVNDDFKYLIDIMTRYEEPNNTILGFLGQNISHTMPKSVRNQIKDYLNIHRETYVKNLQDMTGQFAVNDGETMIHIILTANSLTEEEQMDMYAGVRRRLEHEFADTSYKPVCDELLSVLMDKRLHSSLNGLSTMEIVQKLNKQYTSNTAYILYTQYIDIDQERFLPYCPLIAEHLLNSYYSGCWHPLAMYFEETEEEEMTEEHYQVALLLYQYGSRGCTSALIEDLLWLMSILSRLLEKKNVYMWVQEEEAHHMIFALEQRIEEIKVIEAQAYFNRRKWGWYGILLYMRFLLKNDIAREPYTEEEYASMSSEEKLVYCESYFTMITPFLKRSDGAWVVNQTYLDLLNYLIENKGDIQSVMAEHDGLQKIANDTIDVVQRQFTDLGKRDAVIEMIKKYMYKFNEINL